MSVMSFLSLFLIIVFYYLADIVHFSDGYFRHTIWKCTFSRRDLSDLEFLYQSYFNSVKYIQFNSTAGKFEGYTAHGVYNAELWNNDPAQLAQLNGEKDRFCVNNAAIEYKNVLSKTAEPYIRLRSVKSSNGKHPAMLVCSAYDFYPKQIKVTWLRDGKEVTSEVTSTEELADGDWYYQIHSNLEYTPQSGEKIACMVEHASFSEPKVYDWDPSLPESERNKIAIGASGLVLGIVIAAAGLIYYKKKKSMGRVLVPN